MRDRRRSYLGGIGRRADGVGGWKRVQRRSPLRLGWRRPHQGCFTPSERDAIDVHHAGHGELVGNGDRERTRECHDHLLSGKRHTPGETTPLLTRHGHRLAPTRYSPRVPCGAAR